MKPIIYLVVCLAFALTGCGPCGFFSNNTSVYIGANGKHYCSPRDAMLSDMNVKREGLQKDGTAVACEEERNYKSPKEAWLAGVARTKKMLGEKKGKYDSRADSSHGWVCVRGRVRR